MSSLPLLDPTAVSERLDFARKRLVELQALNGGRLAGANAHERQQLIQEFFFHLLGAVDVLAQLVNEQRSLGHDSEVVTIGFLHNKLPAGSALDSALRALYVKTRGQPLPTDPYTDDAYVFRAYNYRHQVTHRRANPFLFRVGATPPVSLALDPRLPMGDGPNHSVKDYQDELNRMLDIITVRIDIAIGAL